jgi:hypothetical protein
MRNHKTPWPSEKLKNKINKNGIIITGEISLDSATKLSGFEKERNEIDDNIKFNYVKTNSNSE